MIRVHVICLWAIILVAVAGCAAQGRVPVSGIDNPGPEPLPKSEFDYLDVRVGVVPDEYVYRTYRRTGTSGRFSLFRGGVFGGVLLLRKPNGLYSLLDGTLTDKRFNRILVDPVDDGQVTRAWLHVASMPDGSRLAGLAPADGDGELSLVVLWKEDLVSVFLARELSGLLPCIDRQAAEGSMSGIVNCASPGTGSGSDPGALVGGALDQLGEPDCGENLLGPVSFQIPGYPPRRTGAQRAGEILRERQQLSEYINNDLRGDPEAQEVYRSLSGALAIEQRANERLAEAEAEANEHYTPGRSPTAEERAAQRRAEARVRAAQSGVRAAERNRAEKEKDVQVFERNRRRASGRSGSGSGSNLPVIGSEGEREDPRCQGRRIDAERGTLFTNPDFCGDDDMLTCLRREQDSLFSIFEGQCWREIGPDDAPRIVCRSRDPRDQLSADPGNYHERECEHGETDCWTDPVAPITSSGKIAARYVDFTPMAGILIGLCARGGCPRTE